MLDLLEPEQPASIERDVFPRLVGDGLYGCVADGYWLDIGTPERYLQGTFDILEATVGTAVAERMGDAYLCVEEGVENAGRIIPPALVESGCRIGEGARDRRPRRARARRHGRRGHDDRARRGACRAPRSAATARCAAASSAGGVRIGDHCTIDGLSVLGEGVTLGAGNVVSNGARLFPGVTLPDGAILF